MLYQHRALYVTACWRAITAWTGDTTDCWTATASSIHEQTYLQFSSALELGETRENYSRGRRGRRWLAGCSLFECHVSSNWRTWLVSTRRARLLLRVSHRAITHPPMQRHEQTDRGGYADIPYSNRPYYTTRPGPLLYGLCDTLTPFQTPTPARWWHEMKRGVDWSENNQPKPNKYFGQIKFGRITHQRAYL